MRHLLLVAFSILVASTGVGAEPVEDEQYDEQYEGLRLLAEQGNEDAQFTLGTMYAYGVRGIKKDQQEAEKWLRKAAEHGSARIQLNLGSLYYDGLLRRDYQEAMKWYRRAAEQGNAAAQVSVGRMYEYAQSVRRDYQEATKWYRKAAEQGYSVAQSNLGHFYFHGMGITQDFIRAHMWFNLSAVAPSLDNGKSARELRDDVATRMTAEQIAQAQEMARHCQHTKFKECD